jgi:hypothetical protein
MVLFCGNKEPTLEELLGDPITRLLFARDRVKEEDMRALLDAVRQKLRGGVRRRSSSNADLRRS